MFRVHPAINSECYHPSKHIIHIISCRATPIMFICKLFHLLGISSLFIGPGIAVAVSAANNKGRTGRYYRALRGIDTKEQAADPFFEETAHFWGRALDQSDSIGSNDDKPTPTPTVMPSRAPRTQAPTRVPTLPPTPEPTSPPTSPPIDSSCNIGVDIECTTEAATINGTGHCDAILPIGTRCDARATRMEMKYNGGDCTQSFNIQEADKFDCTDYLGGPGLAGSAWIVVTSKKDPTLVYFEGTVPVGGTFNVTDGGDRLEADSTVSIFEDSNKTTLLQVSNFHTSCSQNLFLKDRYGAVQVAVFVNDLGTFSCFVDAMYSYALTNTGSANDATITQFTSTTKGETIDILVEIGENFTISSGETVIVTAATTFDMTVRQNYEIVANISAETSLDGECEDTDTLELVAGNPSPF